MNVIAYRVLTFPSCAVSAQTTYGVLCFFYNRMFFLQISSSSCEAKDTLKSFFLFSFFTLLRVKLIWLLKNTFS